ncbi:hypothetical protein COD67_04010 [Bacillus cereus]|nr:hypothetical protein COI89_22470 [Bacillus cereus]PGU69809.1 hypothetical protein COD67_04010 [Bacillus cereus]
MKNILYLMQMEVRKAHGKSMYLFLFLFILFTTLDNILHYKYNVAKPDLLVGNFGLSLFITQIYLIYLASTYLSSEFSYGTSKNIFTGAFTRIEIINIKTFALLLYSITLAIVNICIGIAGQLIVHSDIIIYQSLIDLLKLVFIYWLYFFSVLAFSLLVSSISLNRLYTIIISYAAFIFIGELAAQVTSRDNSKLKDIIENVPFYVVTNGFSSLHYSINSVIYIVIFSIFTYVIGLLIYKKRDLI